MRKSYITKERYKHIIEYIDRNKCTGWEVDFLNNIEDFWDDAGFLTKGQAEKLEEVYKQRR